MGRLVQVLSLSGDMVPHDHERGWLVSSSLMTVLLRTEVPLKEVGSDEGFLGADKSNLSQRLKL